jgi:phosphomannomutase
VIDELEKFAEKQADWHIAPDNREGIRVSFDKDNGDGWFLLRLSVHDPILPLNIESDSEGGVEIIRDKVMAFLKTQNGIVV